jgi:hypothetical protein
MRSSRDQSLREIATTKGTNPASYSANAQTQESGVARMIANIPHERRLRELRPVFTAFEEQQLLPALIDVHDSFGPATIGEGVRPRVMLAEPLSYEDTEAKQRRLLVDLDQGVISKARYAVEMGHFATIEDAVAAGLSNDLGSQGLARAVAGEVMTAPAEDGVDVNQLTLGIERLGRLGDVDALNVLRAQLAAKLGSTISPVTAEQLARGATPLAEVEQGIAPAEDGEE